MTIQEIEQAIADGKKVYWQSGSYQVVKDSKIEDKYYIKCMLNNHMIGLTWADKVTMNGKESEFFTN